MAQQTNTETVTHGNESEPKVYTDTIAFRCPRELYERAHTKRLKERSSIQQMCIDALTQYLDREQNAA